MSTLKSPSYFRFYAFLVCATLFLAVVAAGLLVPLYSGLLSYALVMQMAPRLPQQAGHATARLIAASLIGLAVVGVLTLLSIAVQMLIGDGDGVHALVNRMGEILVSAREWLPASVSALLPEPEALLAQAGHWLQQNASAIGTFGLGALKTLGYVLIGLLLGAMVAVAEATRAQTLGPVGTRLLTQIDQLRLAFWRVVRAQVKISALNTVLTASYLLVILPLAGVQLPFAKTLVAVTFFAGLLPVVGNLISNTAITVISLSHSPMMAAVSLGFLVVVHKLEYFVNAKIVGSQINARAWELLLWMLLLERLLGPAGVVVAPVLCAWLKTEWALWDVARDRDRDLAGKATGAPGISAPAESPGG